MKHSTICIYLMTAMLLPLSSMVSHAHLEQPLLSVDSSNKKATLAFFHFNTEKQSDNDIVTTTKNLGSTLKQHKALAGVSYTAESGVTINSGVPVIAANANFLVKNSKAKNAKMKNLHHKSTFLLTNGKGLFAIGYAPNMTPKELSFALQEYCENSSQKYHTAVLLAEGNQCAFYKDNGEYHPYYLKELKPAKSLFAVK